MSEHMMPIPSRIYNAAVGGHVAGADQIIDDETGLTLDKVAGGALEEKEYTSGSDNGMGRVVLRRNLVNGVNTLTQSMINKTNTIYVIQYNFVLGENITVPENCVLEFDGGSMSNGAIAFVSTILTGCVKIDCQCSGTLSNIDLYMSWFFNKITNIININLNNKQIHFDRDITLDAPLNITYDLAHCVFDGHGNTVVDNSGEERTFITNTNCSIADVTIRNFKYIGSSVSNKPMTSFIRLNANEDTTISKVEIYNNNVKTVKLGISLSGDLKTTAGHPITDCLVHDNIIDCDQLGMSNPDVSWYGIHIPNARRCRVYNNHISNAKTHAIYHPYGYDNEISGNIIDFCDFIAVLVTRDSVNISVKNNLFIDNKCSLKVNYQNYDGTADAHGYSDGINNVIVDGNTFKVDRSTTDEVIEVGNIVTSSAPHSTKNVKITNNIFDVITRDSYSGIHIIAVSPCVGLDISSNMFKHHSYNSSSILVNGIFMITGGMTDEQAEQMDGFNITSNIFLFNDSANAIYFNTKYISSSTSKGYTFRIANNSYLGRRGQEGIIYTDIAGITRNDAAFIKKFPYVEVDTIVKVAPAGSSFYNITQTGFWNIPGDIIIGFNNNNKLCRWLCTEAGNPATWLNDNEAAIGSSRSGTTRPLGKAIYVGYSFFDTSISPARPIYAKAISGDTVTWVDATGTPV